MGHEVMADTTREEAHSLIIQAIVEDRSLDRSDVMIYPREEQRIYQKYADRFEKLIQSEVTKAQEQLLDELEAMIDNHPNYINKSVIKAKRKEIKEGK